MSSHLAFTQNITTTCLQDHNLMVNWVIKVRERRGKPISKSKAINIIENIIGVGPEVQNTYENKLKLLNHLGCDNEKEIKLLDKYYEETNVKKRQKRYDSSTNYLGSTPPASPRSPLSFTTSIFPPATSPTSSRLQGPKEMRPEPILVAEEDKPKDTERHKNEDSCTPPPSPISPLLFTALGFLPKTPPSSPRSPGPKTPVIFDYACDEGYFGKTTPARSHELDL